MEEKLAVEMLKELKNSSKRWFVAFCVMVALEILTIAGFMWYISLPIEETVSYTQEANDVDDSSTVRQVIGEDYGMRETD